MRLRKGPMIAALYPVVMLLVQLVLAWLAGWVRAAVLVAGAALGRWAGSLGLALAVWAVLGWFQRHGSAGFSPIT